MHLLQFSEIKVGDVIRTNGSYRYINATWTVGTVSCIHNDYICLKDYDFDLSFKQKAINKKNTCGGCNGVWWVSNLSDAKFYLEEPEKIAIKCDNVEEWKAVETKSGKTWGNGTPSISTTLEYYDFKIISAKEYFGKSLPEPVSEKTQTRYTKMNRLTNKIKRLFNADKRTLYKAGYITECGDLTPEGKQELDYILWEVNEKELVKLAEEKLAEENK